MPKPRHVLQSGYFHPVLRSWQTPNVDIGPHNLMWPIFVGDTQEMKPFPTMPEVSRIGTDSLGTVLKPAVQNGLKSILLFGIPEPGNKDEYGHHADSQNNPVILAVTKIRNLFPDLIIACDVCLCAYTSHGHCGILNNGVIDNDLSIQRIAQVALAYAQAGAHIVAPSDMMDGRVAAIKHALFEGGFGNRVSVLSYSAKFASGLYGPFRDGTNSAPVFSDRKCYQLPPGSKGLAKRAVARDVAEGCDMLMVKPGVPYLDVVKQTKEAFPEYPLFVYQVSGEYTMLYYGAQAGALNLQAAVEEILLSMRRAGADCIITYFTPKLLEWIQKKSKL